VVVDVRDPAQERDDVLDLLRREVLLRHLPVRRGEDHLRRLEPPADGVLPQAAVRAGEVRRVVGAEPEDGVAVVAVVPLEGALPGDHVVVEGVGVRERAEAPVRLDRHREEHRERRERAGPEDPLRQPVGHGLSSPADARAPRVCLMSGSFRARPRRVERGFGSGRC
jgi:hypothetical protein